MITVGQARRLARTYSINANSIARRVDISGFVPAAPRAQYEQEVVDMAHMFPDPQGVYADARAWADWCEENQGYVRNWHNIREDDRQIPWAYRRGE